MKSLAWENDLSEPEAEPYYMQQHAAAVQEQKHWYVDARTGFLVFTSLYLEERGYCCQAGCRHCPYGFKAKG